MFEGPRNIDRGRREEFEERVGEGVVWERREWT